MKNTLLTLATATTLCVGSSAHALTFTFTQDNSGVTMTTSGSIDVSGLVLSSIVAGWGGTGVTENGQHDIMGHQPYPGVAAHLLPAQTYDFHTGTDFSPWASADGPFSADFFAWVPTTGAEFFATYGNNNALIDNNILPGLTILTTDLVGDIWSSNQQWFASGESFTSIGLNLGVYTVTDSVSGEFISIVVEDDDLPAVPLPAGFPLLAGGLGLLALLRRKKMAR